LACPQSKRRTHRLIITLAGMNSFKAVFREAHKKLGASVTSTRSPEPSTSPIFEPVSYSTPHERLEDDDEPPPLGREPAIPYSPPTGLGLSSRIASEESSTATEASTESSTVQNQIYRVQGLPTDCIRVEDVLRSLLSPEAPIAVKVRSLAISHDPDTLVATISLESIPPSLSPSCASREDDWRFTYDISPASLRGDDIKGATHKRCEITFDTHFRGLTILWSPQKSADHKIE
jgi:hypothetical protein